MKVDVAYSKGMGSGTSTLVTDVFSEDARKGINDDEVGGAF